MRKLPVVLLLSSLFTVPAATRRHVNYHPEKVEPEGICLIHAEPRQMEEDV